MIYEIKVTLVAHRRNIEQLHQ